MIFEQGVYRLDVDVERTRAFYEAKLVGDGCDCAGCRNFGALRDRMPEHFTGFLRQFGIDPMKPAEMSAVYAPEKEYVLYDGWYHVCGIVLNSEAVWYQIEDTEKKKEQCEWGNLDAGSMMVYIEEKRDLLSAGFPEPVIQVNVMCVLPWVLDEENPY